MKPTAFRLCSSCALLITTLLVMGQGACNTQIENICDDMCDCTGCTDLEYETCVDDAEDAAHTAEEKDCVEVLDTYLSCVREELECTDDESSYDGCDSEEELLRDCGVSVFRSICEVANEHTLECGFGTVVPVDSPCEGSFQCQAQCFANASCEAISGIDPVESTKFIQCLNGCPGGF